MFYFRGFADTTVPCHHFAGSHSKPCPMFFNVRVDNVSRAAENIYALSNREKEFGNKGSSLHRSILGLMFQGGYITHYNDIGGNSIYTKKCENEHLS